MNAIAEFVVKVADLVEAEGRSARTALRQDVKELREGAGKFVFGTLIVVAGVLMATVGVALWIAAVYIAVAEAAGAAWGAVSAGAVSVMMGVACVLLFRRMVCP